MLIARIIENITMLTTYTIEKLHLFLFSLSIVTISILSIHSSIINSTNFFLHLQFLLSKYSPILQDLSHSHSQ